MKKHPIIEIIEIVEKKKSIVLKIKYSDDLIKLFKDKLGIKRLSKKKIAKLLAEGIKTYSQKSKTRSK